MKIKTSELTGAALDWAVAKAEGLMPFIDKSYYGKIYRYGTFVEPGRRSFTPSTDWSQGGPIIERERIHVGAASWSEWVASILPPREARGSGPTPLIAAMRAYVASKLGDEVEIPAGLA